MVLVIYLRCRELIPEGYRSVLGVCVVGNTGDYLPSITGLEKTGYQL